MKKKVFILAGGTGGHVFPALAVAMELQAQGYDIIWLGTEQGLEANVVPAAGLRLEMIKISGFRGKQITRVLTLPWLLLKAIKQVSKLYSVHQPVLVIGFGGYVSGPGSLAALCKRVPLVLHEQNAIPGTTNRVLAKFARRVCQSFPHAFKKGIHAITTGNPVRPEILAIHKSLEAQTQAPLKLLVLGGSQGAKAINEVIPAALKLADVPFKVWHQAGVSKYKETQAFYVENQVDGRVVPFIKNMAQAYEWADLVIARAGATTVAELSIAGCASILIPLPHAVDDHQTKNANYLANQGAAVIMPQSTLSAQNLAQIMSKFAKDRTYLIEVANKAKQLGKRNATQDVIKVCLEALEQEQETHITKKSEYGKN